MARTTRNSGGITDNWGRFDQPDPYDGSYSLANPQSLNRYAYVNNDPVNFVDPTGLLIVPPFIGNFTVDVSISFGGPINSFMWEHMFGSLGGGSGGGGDDTGGGGGGGGGGPQNSQTKPPCPPVPAHPSNADINANMRTARHVAMGTLAGQILTSPSGVGPLAAEAAKAEWFKHQVQSHGPWDYKWQGNLFHAEWEDFGNFHYGAVGIAAGFTPDQLLRMAGYVQEDPKTAEGKNPGLVGSYLGIGGKEPYGDDRQGQDVIKQGIQYAQNGCRP